jgi:hypothetical protein
MSLHALFRVFFKNIRIFREFLVIQNMAGILVIQDK